MRLMLLLLLLRSNSNISLRNRSNCTHLWELDIHAWLCLCTGSKASLWLNSCTVVTVLTHTCSRLLLLHACIRWTWWMRWTAGGVKPAQHVGEVFNSCLPCPLPLRPSSHSVSFYLPLEEQMGPFSSLASSLKAQLITPTLYPTHCRDKCRLACLFFSVFIWKDCDASVCSLALTPSFSYICSCMKMIHIN